MNTFSYRRKALLAENRLHIAAYSGQKTPTQTGTEHLTDAHFYSPGLHETISMGICISYFIFDYFCIFVFFFFRFKPKIEIIIGLTIFFTILLSVHTQFFRTAWSNNTILFS